MPKRRIPTPESPPLIEPALFRLLDVLERVESENRVFAEGSSSKHVVTTQVKRRRAAVEAAIVMRRPSVRR